MLSNVAINQILSHINWTDLPKSIAYAKFPIKNVPSSKWSLVNRVIMVSSGTLDQRGRNQWADVQRYPIKGSKPNWIICPQVHSETIEGESKKICDGFIGIPVYAADATYGDPITYEFVSEQVFNTESISEKWDNRVKGIYKRYEISTAYHEHYEPAGDNEKQFFWNTSLFAYKELFTNHANRADKRIVCELSALALLNMCGRSVNYPGKHYSMIQYYARDLKLSTMGAFMNIIKNVDLVLTTVLDIGLTD